MACLHQQNTTTAFINANTYLHRPTFEANRSQIRFRRNRHQSVPVNRLPRGPWKLTYLFVHWNLVLWLTLSAYNFWQGCESGGAEEGEAEGSGRRSGRCHGIPGEETRVSARSSGQTRKTTGTCVRMHMRVQGVCNANSHRFFADKNCFGHEYLAALARGGSRIPRRRGRQPSKFSKKLHEIQKILGRRGGAPCTPSLNPPMLACLHDHDESFLEMVQEQ